MLPLRVLQECLSPNRDGILGSVRASDNNQFIHKII